jgi:hypothetical protein
MFIYCVPVAGVGFLIALWMKHVPLRGHGAKMQQVQLNKSGTNQTEEEAPGAMVIEM